MHICIRQLSKYAKKKHFWSEPVHPVLKGKRLTQAESWSVPSLKIASHLNTYNCYLAVGVLSACTDITLAVIIFNFTNRGMSPAQG